MQLSSDQNMVIKIKPPSKPGSANAAGVPRGSLEEFEGPPWSNHRPQEGEGEPPGAQRQLPKPGRVKGSCGSEDPGPVCQKEAGKPRVVKSAGSVSDGPSEPRRTVSESAVAVKTRFPSPTLPHRGGVAVGRKLGSHSVSSCVAHLLGDGRVSAGHADQSASSGTGAGPARPASGPRQARESSLPVPCRTKFRKNNYKWVAASAKSARAPRRVLSPRAASELVCKAPCGTAEQEKSQLSADPDARPRRSAASSTAGASPSKYKWKASSPSASSSSSFRWQSEAGSKDHASQLPPVPSRSPPGDRAAVGPSSLKPPFAETPLSAYKVRSRTKIVRRRAVARWVPCHHPRSHAGRPGPQALPVWCAEPLGRPTCGGVGGGEASLAAGLGQGMCAGLLVPRTSEAGVTALPQSSVAGAQPERTGGGECRHAQPAPGERPEAARAAFKTWGPRGL